MKSKYSLIIFCVLSLLLGGTYWAQTNFSPYEQSQVYMDVKDVEARWGKKKFSAEKFKIAKIEERAQMAADLIKNRKLFIGKSAGEVISQMGPNTGYFFTDQLPAYTIYEGWKKNENTWQIIFLLGLNGKIKDIRMHRNCCAVEDWQARGLTPPKN